MATLYYCINLIELLKAVPCNDTHILYYHYISLYTYLSIAQELLDKWCVHIQKQDQTNQFIALSLNTVSPSTQVYGLGVAIQLIINKLMQLYKKESSIIMTSRKRRDDEDGNKDLLSVNILAQVYRLLESDVMRVRVLCAIILLCCLDEPVFNNKNNVEDDPRIEEVSCTSLIVIVCLEQL